MAECSIADCDNESKYASTGWCQTHYHRYWRTGSTDILPKPLRTDLSYRGAHCRVRSVFGAASKYMCAKCPHSWAKEWAYDGTDDTALTEFIGGKYKVMYSVWPEFYMPLCFPCHRGMDKTSWAARRTHCVNRHQLTAENTYTRPSRPHTRECRQCKDDEYVRRRLRIGKIVPSKGIFELPNLTLNGG